MLAEEEESRARLTRLEQQCQTKQQCQAGISELKAYIRFRMKLLIGVTFCLLALVLPTIPAWFSDNPRSGSAPASGLIDHWNFWLILAGGQGGGGGKLPDGAPAGLAIGDNERGLGFLVFLALLFTMVMLLWTLVRVSRNLALGIMIGAAVTVALEFALRFAGNADHQGYPRFPHSYDTAGGLAFAQWGAAAVIVWALAFRSALKKSPEMLDG